MHPKSRSVEPLSIGLAGAVDRTKVSDELEGGEGVVGPGGGEEGGDGGGRGAGDHMEEEVEAGVARGEEGRGSVLGEAHRGPGFIEVGVH